MSFNFVDRSAFFTAAFSLALQAYTGSESAVFTTVYDGRKDPRTSRSVSMFIKTLPVILDFAPGQRVQDAVEATGSWLANAAAHDIFSFAEIHDAWGIGSDVLFAYQGEADGQPVIWNGPRRRSKSPYPTPWRPSACSRALRAIRSNTGRNGTPACTAATPWTAL